MAASKQIEWPTSQTRGWKLVPDLDRMYAFFNRKFFGRSLPKAELFWAVFEDPDKDGLTSEVKYANGKKRPAVLVAWHNVSNYTQLRQTMIHEMVHVEEAVAAASSKSKRSRDHGPEFWDRMAQLMKAGAFKGYI